MRRILSIENYIQYVAGQRFISNAYGTFTLTFDGKSGRIRQ